MLMLQQVNRKEDCAWTSALLCSAEPASSLGGDNDGDILPISLDVYGSPEQWTKKRTI